MWEDAGDEYRLKIKHVMAFSQWKKPNIKSFQKVKMFKNQTTPSARSRLEFLLQENADTLSAGAMLEPIDGCSNF